MAKGIYVGVDNVARRVNQQYVGVGQEFPVFETKTVYIMGDNISEYFLVTNGSYYFENSNRMFIANNKGVPNSIASTKLTLKMDMDIAFAYVYSTEANYDKFTIIVDGTTIENAVSGATTQKSYSGSLKAGATIEFKYTKDSSVDGNEDTCTIYDMRVTTETQIGVENKGVTRKVIKGYIGVNNVARQCFSAGKVWRKYGYYYTEPHYVENTTSSEIGTTRSHQLYWSYTAQNGQNFWSGQSYVFEYSYGFRIHYFFSFHMKDETTIDELRELLVGGYCAIGTHAGTIVSVDSMTTLNSNTPTKLVTITFNVERVADCIDGYWSVGSNVLDSITVQEGELPEDGTLIEGSVNEGYCILQIGSNYYYYVLEG